MGRRAIAAGTVGVLLGTALIVGTRDDTYTVTAVFPNAGNLFLGSSVMRDGYVAGSIKSISVRDGKAVVEMSLDNEFGPLHDGATAEVVWKAVLGERLIRVEDGSPKNSELADGAMLTGVQREPVELDAVLSALDPRTRVTVTSLLQRLKATLGGRETAANQSLHSAAAALRELGAVVQGVDSDGEAIKQLVKQFENTMGILAEHDNSLESIVTGLAATSAAVSRHDDELDSTLRQLPPLLDQAQGTLGRVPGTVDVAAPLLEELAPATGHLRSVSRSLRPLLRDLRPTVAELGPTLESLSQLMQITPDLLDASTVALPTIDSALGGLTPALDFLRPYTPELAGWTSNWGSSAGNYDANGRYLRLQIMTGTEALTGLTSKPGPGVTQNLTPEPGAPVNQPWTDAYGSEMR